MKEVTDDTMTTGSLKGGHMAPVEEVGVGTEADPLEGHVPTRITKTTVRRAEISIAPCVMRQPAQRDCLPSIVKPRNTSKTH